MSATIIEVIFCVLPDDFEEIEFQLTGKKNRVIKNEYRVKWVDFHDFGHFSSLRSKPISRKIRKEISSTKLSLYAFPQFSDKKKVEN